MDKKDQIPVSRRQWFSQGIKMLGRAAVDFNEARKDAEEILAPPPREKFSLDPARGFLRPPGAVPERQFREVCDKCDACIKACPEDVLFRAPESAGDAAGYPMFNPRAKACFLCDPLHCVDACDRGALVKVETIRQLSMGKARINPALCRAHEDEECRYCYDFCPLKESAIIMLGGVPVIQGAECVGCGLCEYYCGRKAGRGAITTLPRLV
ncbi:MAG: 4Fe-4S ferredoxin [Nitrospinae bacterium]|nr:4Fe-4S ferredoxin [Nitrospinota bacterium]